VTDVTVLDTFSTYVDIDSVKTTKGTHDTSSRTVTVDVGTLNAGQSATITVVVKVNNTATTNLTVSNTATLTYKFGTTTYTSGATVSFSILRTTTLPGTGGIELERPAKPQSSGINLIAWLSASFLGLLGLISLILGLIAKIQRSEWAGWVIRMGVMFSLAAVMFGMVAWGLAQFAGVGSQTLGTAMLKSAQKTRLTQGFVQDPPWVGSNQANEPEVLPDFPVPEPTQTAPDENGKPPDTSPVNRIALPSIGVDTVVKYVPYDGDTWLIAGLKQEIAWMGDTSWPGLGGNTGLAGHVSLRDGRDGPFRYLSELVPDDIIILYTDENIYTYKVRETRVVSDSDMTVIQPTQNPQITLITCTNWDATSGSYLDRLVVYADLTSVTPAAGATQGN
jgi:LPXTG-site transpeptidase (sortase) family protein